jgi:2-keto-4-pentenoate hydratase
MLPSSTANTMTDGFDPVRAAAGLADAWRSGEQHEALRRLVRPRDLGEAYETQDRLIDLLGHPVVGWKIGLAGRNAYLGAGLQRPIFGRLLRPRCNGNGDVVAVPRDTAVTVELELALVLSRDVEPGAAIGRDLIGSAHLGFEIVSSRLPDRQTIGVAATVADNAVSHAVVMGDAIEFGPIGSIAAQALITVDGKVSTSPLAGDDLPDPLAVLGHLIDHLGERSQRVRRGDIVFTGTLTKPFAVAAPCDLAGGGAGSFVRCRLEPAP